MLHCLGLLRAQDWAVRPLDHFHGHFSCFRPITGPQSWVLVCDVAAFGDKLLLPKPSSSPNLPFQKAITFLAAAPHFLSSPAIFDARSYSPSKGIMFTVKLSAQIWITFLPFVSIVASSNQHALPPIVGLGGILRILTLPDVMASLHWRLNQRESITLKD